MADGGSSDGLVRRYEAMIREAMYQLAALLPLEYRGVYSDLSAASTRFLEKGLEEG